MKNPDTDGEHTISGVTFLGLKPSTEDGDCVAAAESLPEGGV